MNKNILPAVVGVAIGGAVMWWWLKRRHPCPCSGESRVVATTDEPIADSTGDGVAMLPTIEAGSVFGGGGSTAPASSSGGCTTCGGGTLATAPTAPTDGSDVVSGGGMIDTSTFRPLGGGAMVFR